MIKVALTTMALLVALTCDNAAGGKTRLAEIAGTVWACNFITGEGIRVREIPVYLISEDESTQIWKLLDSTRKATHADDIEQFFESYGKLMEEVKGFTEGAQTRTNEQGRFVFSRVLPGRKYLVLTMDTIIEDAAAFYDFHFTESLRAQKYEVEFWMEVNSKEECSRRKAPARDVE